MINFSRFVRASVLFLAIGGLSLSAGPALAYNYSQTDLANAENNVVFAQAGYDQTYSQYMELYNRLYYGLAEEYQREKDACQWLSPEARAECHNNAYDWYIYEQQNIQIDLNMADSQLVVDQLFLNDAIAWRDEVAADCCTPG